ncbi:hypothetical protein KPH14_001561 [Odynerus spinipes]|uniref:NADH dehydrogenase [ubiquinone] iron-sulfur protein 4, mitochondrial n=1 Tax=Odynerus spinipes TaxID=1348599 RepID=A0AAD9RZ71_9HYME|nr:hypothetical protein KPH14_001561 [Odynerus spinipes]
MAFRVLVRQFTKELNNSGNERFVKLFSTSSVKSSDYVPDPKEVFLGNYIEQEDIVTKLDQAVLDQTKIPDTSITVSTVENVGAVSGVPEEHIKTRMARIYQPSKNAMQSGTNNIHYWQIDFDTRERWENPLIGWTSTGDPMSNTKVNFANKDAAIQHCEKMGWKYYVQKPNVVNPKPRSYGANFAWNKRTRVSTK